jgi:16S rRNA (cytosine967-C5)-methyltransferase
MKVNTTKRRISPKTKSGWVESVNLTVRYLAAPTRADALLTPVRGFLDAREYSTCQQLFYGVLRNLSLLQASVDYLCVRKPIPEARALLMVAGYELLEDKDRPEKRALITHHAVEMSGTILPEKLRGFVNAIVRRMPEAMSELPKKLSDPAARLALQYSHPDWLVKRWIADFGIEAAEKMLVWDQSVPPVYIRMEESAEAPAGLKATQWKNFYSYDGSGWAAVEELLKTHKAYAQDPSTRLSTELLNTHEGESVLDLCAAPGGKAREILPSLNGKGTLVCVDLPGGRCEHLRENLAGDHGNIKVSIIERDVFELDDSVFEANGAPKKFDAVLLDAPCSNIGVIRRRPDARWRVGETDVAKAAELQAKLLEKASTLVADKGRIVYSTCSIDEEENAKLVDAFVKKHPEFTAGASKVSYPWIDGHDGAGAFLLTRNS